MTAPHVETLREEGYAIIRGFVPPDEIAVIERAVDDVYAEGMKYPTTFRHGSLMFEVLNDPAVDKKLVLQVYWFAWINQIHVRTAPPPALSRRARAAAWP